MACIFISNVLGNVDMACIFIFCQRIGVINVTFCYTTEIGVREKHGSQGKIREK